MTSDAQLLFDENVTSLLQTMKEKIQSLEDRIDTLECIVSRLEGS